MNTDSRLKWGSAVIVVAAAALMTSAGKGQTGTRGSIMLQGATPGMSQSGHANISGIFRAGTLAGSGSGLSDLPWSGLAGVPAGFADNIDNDTLYTAGSGLSLVGNQFRVTGPLGITFSNTVAFSSAIEATLSGIQGTAIYGRTTSVDGTGIRGDSTANNGFGIGVYGYASSPNAIGIYGLNQSATGSTVGVRGEAFSPNGTGIVGINSSPTGQAAGIRAIADATGGRALYATSFAPANSNLANYAIYAVTTGQFATTIAATNQSTGNDAVAVFGYSNDSTTGIGVSGSGRFAGIYGNTSGSGYGIYGTYTGAGLAAGFFTTTLSGGRGVLVDLPTLSGAPIGVESIVYAPSGRGVQGDSDATSGTPYAIFGDTDGFGYALYGSGNTGASGTKSFRIDHPLDPENMHLLHYSSESPFPQNFYLGNVVTDGRGYAWVQLPDYFEEINTDFKYQLTVIDDSEDFVQVKVTKEVQNNRFQIRTSKPNVKVSWRVDANRNDAYVRRYPPAAELEKPEGERGLFEHPEIYGLGKDRGMPYDRPEFKKSRLPKR